MQFINYFLLFVIILIQYTATSIKISLFDSTKIKDDLNWSKISFKETSQLNGINSNNWLKDKINNVKNDVYGWKESSFSLFGGDDVWRIYFVCDLNVQNIQNWLFTPLINTKLANRVTLNLTFTIRECEQFPIKQVVKNCREKFELYYEEIKDENFKNELADSNINHFQDLNTDVNRTSLYFLNKIKQLRFRETFVSDTGLRYYNSVVDRQQQTNRNSNRPGESSINVELREIPLSTSSNQNGDSFIRFAIRDTGACISLLSVEVSYVTCPAFTKYGISFPETSTGRDLTDLVQVNGKCPLFTSFSQQPKAICTAKGEWLITDQSLSHRCLCLPGYELDQESCLACPIGYYKSATSNDIKCSACPENSWSNQPGAEKCECLIDFYRENEANVSSGCKQIQQISANNLNITLLNDEKINISLNRKSLEEMSSNILTEIKCYTCTNSVLMGNLKEECDSNCFISSFSNDWITILNKNVNKISQKMKMVIKQKLNDKELAKSIVYVNLNQAKHSKKSQNEQLSKMQLSAASNTHILSNNKANNIQCQFSHNSNLNPYPINNNNKALCLNMSMNLNVELQTLFPKFDLPNKLKQSSKNVQLNIYGLSVSNEYELIPSSSGNNNNQFKSFKTNQLRLFESLDIKSTNNSFLPILLCSVNEVDTLKFELTIKNNNNRNSIQRQDELSFSSFTYDKLEIFMFDVKLNEVCARKDTNDKASSQFLLNKSLNSKDSDQIETEDSLQNTNLKIHVILPIVLGFFFVSFFILLAVFFRRLKFRNCKTSKDKNYNCEKHIRKFMPTLVRSCSSKCIDCSNNASANSSSSSTTSSSSPSTICTTSQIIDRNSKLYYVDPHTYEDPAMVIQEFAQEIAPPDIKIESVIGGGEFGDVCKGKLKNSNNIWVTVAIKTLKVGSSEKNRCDFLTEASIMAQFHHENIICLEGVVTQSHPYMIITEYMDNGSLDTFLRLNSWRLNIYDLVKMLRDIANGMKYLSSMNFVHRDLAARNILVNKSLQCKVADFGLSREIEGTTTEGVYWTKGGKIPVRWTAPEAISHTKFTCSSDVWSYGVVAWEVMSFGERPYWNWSNTDVIKAVEKGFRLLIPPNCPQIIYTMMLDCWEADRLKRPRFKQIVNDLDNLIKSKKECLFANITSHKNNTSKQINYVDTNRPNFTQLTNIHEWLNSLNLSQYSNLFINKRYLNLSQVLAFEKDDLVQLEIWDEKCQNIILESLKCIQFELNFQNGFLV